MIEIKRIVQRVSKTPFAHYRRRIVAAFEPGDILTMRLKGTRTKYSASLDDIFRQLAHWHALAENRRKREERKARRAERR